MKISRKSAQEGEGQPPVLVLVPVLAQARVRALVEVEVVGGSLRVVVEGELQGQAMKCGIG